MVDWNSPEELAKDALAFTRFMHALLGVYAWEFLTSLDFDWQFISGKKRFHWPLIFYFLNRYFMLFSLIGIVIGLDVTSRIDCQALYSFNTVIGASAIGLASINLSIRTMAVWTRAWYIVVPLVILILGHFSLLLQVVTLKATWMPGRGCVITYTDNTVLTATYIYTMIFDFIIMLLMAIKLLKTNSVSHSKLRRLIFTDGLIYFIFAFLANVVATVFILLNLNPIMSVIANIPSTIITTIVACRVVRRLNKFSLSNAETFSVGGHSKASVGFRSGRPNVSMVPKDGIHVQMETFSEMEAKTTMVKYSDDGQEGGKINSYDPESQVVHRKFDSPPAV